MTKKQHARKKAAQSPASQWPITEDWLATAVGLAIILLIRLADISVDWPLFEWFKK